MRKLTTNQVALLQTLYMKEGLPVESFTNASRKSLLRLRERGLVALTCGDFYEITAKGIESIHSVMFASA